ncbi:MAG: flagellar hook-length control protein FliK [Phycisphaerae bacterium]|nr:flagellar hook-length control protein FliK [Phycisphaerae bacterium]
MAPGPAPAVAKSGRAGGSGDFKSALADAASRREQTYRTGTPSGADNVRSSGRSNKSRDSLKDNRPIGSESTESDSPVSVEVSSIVPDTVVAADPQAAGSQLVIQNSRSDDSTPFDGTSSEIVRNVSSASPGEAEGETKTEGDSERAGPINGRVATEDSIRTSIGVKLDERVSSRGAAEGGAAQGVSPVEPAEAEVQTASPSPESSPADRIRISGKSADSQRVVTDEADRAAAETARSPAATQRGRADAPVVEGEEGLRSREAAGDKRRVLHLDAQERPSDRARGAESVFEEKVRRWIDGRREGSSVQDSDAESGNESKLGNGISTPMTRTSGANTAKVTASATEIRHGIRVLSGRGDGAAASVAKLLLEGGGEIGRDHATSETVTTPGSVGTHTSAAGVIADREAAIPANVGMDAVRSSGPSGAGHRVAELLSTSDVQSDPIEALSRTLSTSGGAGRYQATMRLDPPELGQVTVRLRMDQQAMTLQVQTEDASVSRLVESRLSELRDALSAHGIRIERSEVVTRAPETGDARNHGESQQRSSGDWQRSGRESETWDGAQDGRGGAFFRSREGEGDHNSAWDAGWQADESAGPMSSNVGVVRGVNRRPIRDGSVDLVA